MIDLAKRKTLKSISAVGIGTATVSLGGLAIATHSLSADTSIETKTVDELTLQVSHSWSGNDIEMQIQNNTAATTHITQISPSRISTQMGELDFDKLMGKGPIRLAPNESVKISLDTANAAASHAGQSGQFLRSFQKAIIDNFTIVTDRNNTAVLNTVFEPRIV